MSGRRGRTSTRDGSRGQVRSRMGDARRGGRTSPRSRDDAEFRNEIERQGDEFCNEFCNEIERPDREFCNEFRNIIDPSGPMARDRAPWTESPVGPRGWQAGRRRRGDPGFSAG
jgi:hypothetical protein